MAIAKNPKRSTNAIQAIGVEESRVEAFISGAGDQAPADVSPTKQNKEPIMIRIDPNLLSRIDLAAKRLGISRSAFIVSSTAERLERMEQ